MVIVLIGFVLTISDLLLNDMLFGWFGLLRLLLLLLLSLCSSYLLLMMLLLKLDLFLYDLLLAGFVTILMTARVLALVPASAANTWARHYSNYNSEVRRY